MAATIRYLRAVIATNLKTALSLRTTLWLQAGLMMLNNLMFVIVWWVVFSQVDEIRGWRLGDLLVLQGVVACGYGVSRVFFGGAPELARRIEDGDLDGWLTQPKPVLLQALVSRSEASGIGDFVSGVIMLALSGMLDATGWLWATLAMLCGGVIFTSFEVLTHALAFWLGKISSFSRQAAQFLIIFSLYPRTIFGGWLKALLFTLLPAGLVGYLPKELVTNPSAETLALVIGGTMLWLLLALFVFNRGLRRYGSGSRFGVMA